MPAPFTIDEKAIRSLAADTGVGEACTATAAHLATTASDLAPDKTGFNKRSYKSQAAEVVDGADGHPVQQAIAYSDDPFAHLVEFGSANNTPYRPLTRAAETLGLDFKDAVA